MGRAASAILALTLAACGTGAQPSPTVTAPPPATATASPTPARSASAAGPWTFAVDPASKTTVRVREVLAQVRLPGDAVLTATGMKGSFTLNPDGSFAPSSRITADLSTLASDSRQRDQYIRENTLETRRFPLAEFVPTKATGLTLPLPASGDMTFTLSGTMTLRGVTKDVSFDVKATRSGAKLAATATLDPVWKFADFGMTIPRVASVLSIEDELRVEVELVATES